MLSKSYIAITFHTFLFSPLPFFPPFIPVCCGFIVSFSPYTLNPEPFRSLSPPPPAPKQSSKKNPSPKGNKVQGRGRGWGFRVLGLDVRVEGSAPQVQAFTSQAFYLVLEKYHPRKEYRNINTRVSFSFYSARHITTPRSPRTLHFSELNLKSFRV